MLSWRGTPATQDYRLRIEEPQSTQRTQSEEWKEISLFFSATSAFSAVTCIRASKLAGGIFPDPKSAWPAEVAKCLHCGPWPGPKRRAGPPRKHAARKLRMLSPWSLRVFSPCKPAAKAWHPPRRALQTSGSISVNGLAAGLGCRRGGRTGRRRGPGQALLAGRG